MLLREKSAHKRSLAWAESDQKAEAEAGGTQLLGPVHPWGSQLSGPCEEKVRHSRPGARYTQRKKKDNSLWRVFCSDLGF